MIPTSLLKDLMALAIICFCFLKLIPYLQLAVRTGLYPKIQFSFILWKCHNTTELFLCVHLKMTGYIFFLKMIAIENSEKNLYSYNTVNCYFNIMWNKPGEYLNSKSSFENTSQYEMMLTIRNKIYSFPDVPRSIGWVAHETSMSRSLFQHLYKKCFGVTFIQDLLNSRISFSKMLLITTDLPISDISKKCGFKNYKHFARIFKRECGQSALIYRNENRKKK